MPGFTAIVAIIATFVVMRVFNGKAEIVSTWENRDSLKGSAAKRAAKKAVRKKRVAKNKAAKKATNGRRKKRS